MSDARRSFWRWGRPVAQVTATPSPPSSHGQPVGHAFDGTPQWTLPVASGAFVQALGQALREPLARYRVLDDEDPVDAAALLSPIAYLAGWMRQAWAHRAWLGARASSLGTVGWQKVLLYDPEDTDGPSPFLVLAVWDIPEVSAWVDLLTLTLQAEAVEDDEDGSLRVDVSAWEDALWAQTEAHPTVTPAVRWSMDDPSAAQAVLGFGPDDLVVRAPPTLRVWTEGRGRLDPSLRKRHRALLQALDTPLPLAVWPTEDQWQGFVEEFPWARAGLEQMGLQLRFWQQVGDGVIRLPPLLLVGPPGCGKTRLAQRLGERMGLPSLTISGAGTSGGQVIMGVERAWANAGGSPLLRLFHQHHCASPLVVVDEIDKAAHHPHAGSLQDALLPLLEPESARRFHDPFYELSFDLSAVNWVLTANDRQGLSAPLLSRLQTIDVGHPRAEHLPHIAQAVRRDLAERSRAPLHRLPEWEASDTAWVLKQMNHGVFTVREARAWVEQRLMQAVVHPKAQLSVVPSGGAP